VLTGVPLPVCRLGLSIAAALPLAFCLGTGRDSNPLVWVTWRYRYCISDFHGRGLFRKVLKKLLQEKHRAPSFLRPCWRSRY
jgi:hypothetical protein